MKLQITVAHFVLAIAVLFMIGACTPTATDVVPLPSPTSVGVVILPSPIPATPTQSQSETSSGPCRFKSNGDSISGWYWLRDADYAAYGEWTCQGLPADQDVIVNLQTLVTQRTSGGSGYSTPVKVTYTHPTDNNSQTIQIYLQNPLPEHSPADSHGVGYSTTGYLVIPRSYLGAGGTLRIRLERFSPNVYPVAVNANTVNFQRPHLADEFTPPKGSLISGWYWLRDSAHSAYGQWTFRELTANAPFLLILDALVTNGTNGGSGYSMPIAITLINPTNKSQKTLSYVQAQNLLFTQDPANSKGYGYQTYGSIALEPGYIDATGNLIVRVARSAAEKYHLAMNQNSVGVIQQGTAIVSATPLPPATSIAGFENVSRPPGGKYLFIQYWNKVAGTGTLPALAIDFPDYRFDPQAGTLSPFVPGRSITLASTSWGFIGHGTSRSGAAGTGAVSSLSTIDRLAYSIDVAKYTGAVDLQAGPNMEETKQVGLKVLAVADDGSILIEIDNQPITLAVGESWTQTVEADVNEGQYTGHLSMTSTLTNYGWQDRSQITGSQ